MTHHQGLHFGRLFCAQSLRHARPGSLFLAGGPCWARGWRSVGVRGAGEPRDPESAAETEILTLN